MSHEKNNFPKEKSERIVLFADLRDSTDILMNFEQGVYHGGERLSDPGFTYEGFILDLHETTYKELYLGHEYTYAEIYGDGVMGVFPEDNTKYILENIYSLTTRMRIYNDSDGVGVSRPRIDVGFGVTVGKASFVYYPLDGRHHVVGPCVHEAARIEGVSKFYDARILISHRFFDFAQVFLVSDPRFSYRFIDRVILKGMREPVTLFEILLDNDPRFERKKNSIPAYENAYAKYVEGKWKEAKKIFLSIYHEYGLGIGTIMARRCDLLHNIRPGPEWDAIWRLKDK